VTEAPVRVVIVEDQEIYRRGLRAQFELDSGIEVIDEFGTALEAVEAVPNLNPSVVLMDLRLPWRPNESPRYCGAEAIRQIRQKCPDAVIAVITAYGEMERVREALLAGARTYVLKEASADELIQTVHWTARGLGILDHRISGFLSTLIAVSPNGGNHFPELTLRENQTLKLIGDGRSNDEVAKGMGVTRKTVENRLSDILRKLQVSTRKEAIERAIQTGLSKPDGPESPGESG
jgi:two-component system, NarL family, response regulator LiaR